MAKIYYSMAGEGRGHATRVKSVVEALRHEHQFVLFAPGDAYDLLAPYYRGSEVRVVRIPCLRFSYSNGHRLAWGKTTWNGLRYLLRFPRLVRRLESYIRKSRPDLVIADFEPALPRAARRLGIPFLSLNHQHFLVVSVFSRLPWKLRFHAWWMGLGVRLYHQGQAATIVSSFCFPPVKEKHRNVHQIGVLLRPEILSAEVWEGEHLVAYLRRFSTPNVLETLRSTDRPVKVYGLGKRPPEGNLEFFEISESGFLRDLASASALICTAGNQLLGEAQFLRKPAFALPEESNYEQTINAWYLHYEGKGDWSEMRDFDPAKLRDFLERLPEYRANIKPERVNGLPGARRILRSYLAEETH